MATDPRRAKRRRCPFCDEVPATAMSRSTWRCGTRETWFDDDGHKLQEPLYDTGSRCDANVFREAYIRALDLLREAISHDLPDDLVTRIRDELADDDDDDDDCAEGDTDDDEEKAWDEATVDDVIDSLLMTYGGAGWSNKDGDPHDYELRQVIDTWSASQRREVAEYAAYVYLSASDNDDVVVPERPQCLTDLANLLKWTI